jgi:hypothetical protein
MSERQLNLFRSKRQRGATVKYEPAEFKIHCMVADTLRRWAAPNWVCTHFPAGEHRSDATGARLKRMGVVPGLPDFLLFPPLGAGDPHVHCLELKRRGAKLTEHQAGFALWCKLNGYPHAVAHSYEEAVAVLTGWGVLRSGVHVQ